MAGLETVYAVHNFDAENDDELNFIIGEPILVIQKDDGFGDGWWKGQNTKGEVGIFPMNYITQQQQQYQSQLPTPSTSGSTKRSHHHIDISRTQNQPKRLHSVVSSLDSSYSFNSRPPIKTVPSSTISTTFTHHSNTSNQLRKAIIRSLQLPPLRSTSPENWDVDQVSFWINAMDFGSIADNFKLQDITGDVLLELNMNSLKELDIPTFGKRFKVQNVINALREEWYHQMGHSRMSVASLAFSSSEDQQKNKSIPTSPLSHYSTYRHSTDPRYNQRQRRNYQDHQHKTQHHEEEDDDEDDYFSIGSKSPMSPLSPITPVTPRSPRVFLDKNSKLPSMASVLPSSYGMTKNDHIKSEINQRVPNLSIDETMININKPQTILPMTHPSSMDIYSGKADEGNVSPDMEGWLHKQSCKYKKWNKRWFVLKGANLFYFKSPKDIRMKGIINLRGYRIIPDETIYPGKYSFKAQHQEERTFYFYTDLESSMRSWITSLMKSTISRDFSAPVLSSNVVPTVSLDIALRMRPRPPSVLLYKKDKSNEQEQQDKGGRMSRHGSSNQLQKTSFESTGKPPNNDSGFDSDVLRSSSTQDEAIILNDEEDDTEHENSLLLLQQEEEMLAENSNVPYAGWLNSDYIQWINTVSSTANIITLSELRRGDLLIDILEELSGEQVNMLQPLSTVNSESVLILDNIVSVFKFMNEQGIEINDRYTVQEIYNGSEDKIILMLQSILEWSIQLNDSNSYLQQC